MKFNYIQESMFGANKYMINIIHILKTSFKYFVYHLYENSAIK